MNKVNDNKTNIKWSIIRAKFEEREENKKSMSKDETYVVELLDFFEHVGPHGKHLVMIFELVSVNLLEVIKK